MVTFTRAITSQGVLGTHQALEQFLCKCNLLVKVFLVFLPHARLEENYHLQYDDANKQTDSDSSHTVNPLYKGMGEQNKINNLEF